MVATNLRAETLSLMDERADLEAAMDCIISNLSAPGAPGLNGPLLDSEGFPRSDIDIPLVLSGRRRLSELRNEYKELTEKINRNIHILHSARLTSPSIKVSGNDGGSSTVDTVASEPLQDVLVNIPFAMVDEIADASPAVEDGIQLGDQILKFGNVEAGDNLLQRLTSEAQSNVGRAVPVVIMRQGTVINLTVTPRNWQGRGLLGCHFQIL